MKKLILFFLLLMSVQVFGQKKGKVDPRDLQIDSLTKMTRWLTAQLDSVSLSSEELTMKLDAVTAERDKYLGVYTTVRDRVVKYEFDPAATSRVLDSLEAHRDSTMTGAAEWSASLSDSIRLLKEEKVQLQAKVDSMAAAAVNKDEIIVELKQLKGLLDEKIITQEEFNEKKSKLLEKWE
jgi:hypothetical protein